VGSDFGFFGFGSSVSGGVVFISGSSFSSSGGGFNIGSLLLNG